MVSCYRGQRLPWASPLRELGRPDQGRGIAQRISGNAPYGHAGGYAVVYKSGRLPVAPSVTLKNGANSALVDLP